MDASDDLPMQYEEDDGEDGEEDGEVGDGPGGVPGEPLPGGGGPPLGDGAEECPRSNLRDRFGIHQDRQGRAEWNPSEIHEALRKQGKHGVVQVLLQEYRAMYALLIEQAPSADGLQLSAPHAFAVWGITDPHQLTDADAIDRVTWDLKSRVFELMVTIENFHLFNQPVFVENGVTQVGMNHMLEKIWHLGAIVHSEAHCRALIEGKRDYRLRSSDPLNRFTVRESLYESFRTPYAKLIYKMLWWLHEHGKVRYKGAVRRKKLTPDGHFTRYYVHELELEEWVYDFGTTHKDIDNWAMLLDNGRSSARDAAKYLAECREDLLFPEIRKNRTLFAFTNGLYDARLSQFYSYDSPECHALPASEVAAKYFPVPFDTNRYASHVDVPTPNLDKVFRAQEFEPEVVDWLLAMMGRFVFPTDDLDSWQVMLFLKGLGGSGKSTLLKIIAAFYDPEDVGLIGNNIEGTFGLEGLYSAFVTLCLEMKGSFNLDQAVFQSMVSGEAVSVARKNKTAVKADWTSPLGVAANESFPYQDNAGNMARRLVAVYFSKVPRQPDQRLMRNILEGEMANILRKCVEAYLNKVRLFAKRDLWSRVDGQLVLPQQFHDLKFEMQAESNPLSGFVAEEARWERPGPGDDPEAFYVLASAFREAYGAYAEENGLTKQKWQPQVYRPVLTLFGCRMAKNESRRWSGHLLPAEDWVVGLRFNAQFRAVAMEQ